MSTTGIPGMLLAWDVSWNVVASLELLRWCDPSGNYHLVDFEAHEAISGRMRDCWYVPEAIGSGSWPEWLAIEDLKSFIVRIDHAHPLRIRSLIHKESGYERARAAIVEEIARRREQAIRNLAAEVELPGDVRIDFSTEQPIDVRDLVGGPGRPLRLDKDGRTAKSRPVRPWLMMPVAGPPRVPAESTADVEMPVADNLPVEARR